jgi:hypothetical protein
MRRIIQFAARVKGTLVKKSSLGTIANRAESIRKPMKKSGRWSSLGPRKKQGSAWVGI